MIAPEAAAILAAAPPGPIGVAVSGGGDSVALLLLVKRWAAASGRTVEAVTVDHGLRPESATEAAAVARLCATLGIAHAVRIWTGAEASGNLQDRARRARRGLIAAWARERGIGAVALGHTLDDQAETFLLRLARGSGIDGLAAMRPVGEIDGIVWLRPLLGVRRETLRGFLRAEGIGWCEDPSNADPRFDRVRARAALVELATLGLGPERLAATAGAMGQAREALEAATADLAAAAARPGPGGDVALDPAAMLGAPREIRLRLLAGTLAWVAGAIYRPALAPLEAVLAAIETRRLRGGLTLHGCVLRPVQGQVAVRREPRHAGPAVPLSRRVWDGRWHVAPVAGDVIVEPVRIAALGAGGLAAVPAWRDAGIARETLLTTPAVWQGGELMAAPVARPEENFHVRRIEALPPPWQRTILR